MTATANGSAATAQQRLSSTSPVLGLGTTDRGMELCIARSSRPGLGVVGEMSEEDRLWPGRVRRIGRAQLRRWKLDDLCEPAELCLSELVTPGPLPHLTAIAHQTTAEPKFSLALAVYARHHSVAVVTTTRTMIDLGTPDTAEMALMG
ncbi:hypothetical protein ACFYSH_33185 [Streptomyces sp. NPDC005791]|jgi:hypothetical protein|uniref:hypothetical protein n=1 Tax=Streptomyces sp. NPDC005791 TaxID=3364732 RepID=UPI0036D1913D